MKADLSLLPLGTSDFSLLRADGQIYVDKTEFVCEMASGRRKYFLSRPRRFGKSLLVSTFESLFKYGLRDFEGLAIEKQWKDAGHYGVVRLDFSEIKQFGSSGEFRLQLCALLARKFGKAGFSFVASDLFSVHDQLSGWLEELPSRSLVVLIDEYDAPLTACLDNVELFDEVRRELSNFYATIKSNDRALRFFFMTGITKFSRASVFSELNNLTDISLDSRYGSLLGYTHDEVEKNFGGYLDNAAEILGIGRRELMCGLTEHYDGFCFDEKAEFRLFAPWSLLNFLSRPDRGYINYWFESAGNPTVLRQYLKGHSLRDPNDHFKQKYLSVPLLSATAADAEHINDLALLTQTGYLTIKGMASGSFILGYPNREVADSIAWVYRNMLLAGRDINELGASELRTAVLEGEVDSLMTQLNSVLLSLDYGKYPVGDETTCRNYAQLILTLGSGVRTFAELHNALGRSDLEIETPRFHWVFEFKFQRSGESAEKMLEKAVLQIRERRYGEGSSGERKLLRIAAVFSGEERRFVAWKTCGEER